MNNVTLIKFLRDKIVQKGIRGLFAFMNLCKLYDSKKDRLINFDAFESILK